MKQVTVAVTGLDCRENPYPGLAIARSLRANPAFQGRLIALTYDVMTTGIYRDDVFDAVYIVPYPSEPEKKLLSRLMEIHRTDPMNAIFPALDSEIAVYSRLAVQLNSLGIRTLLPDEASVKARNKDNLAGTCDRLRIRTPRTVVITHIEQLDEPIPGLKYPMVIKGALADAHVINNTDELKMFYLKILGKWGFPVLLQEKINGEEFDVAAIAGADHETVAGVAIRKFAISERGKASAGIVVADPKLYETANEILRRMKWRGPCELELMREESSGRYFLLEINARFPAWIFLSAAAGCNLPAIALDMMLNRLNKPVPGPEAGTIFFRNRFGHVVDPGIMGDLLNSGAWIRDRGKRG